MSIEMDLLPHLINEKSLSSVQFQDYWADIGKPSDYLKAMRMHLHQLFLDKDESLASPSKDKIIGNVVIVSNSKINPKQSPNSI